MLVSDRRQTSRSLADLAREAARAGLDDLQVREKDLGGNALLALVREAEQGLRGSAVRLIVNGRPDVAEAAGTHAVQLPEDGLPVSDVRRAFPDLLVGASRHSVEGVRQAEGEGAHFVLLGPVFLTPGKEARALGVDVLAAAAQAVAIPVYAVGGIDALSVRRAVGAGARGVALLRPFLTASVAATLAELRAALG